LSTNSFSEDSPIHISSFNLLKTRPCIFTVFIFSLNNNIPCIGCSSAISDLYLSSNKSVLGLYQIKVSFDSDSFLESLISSDAEDLVSSDAEPDSFLESLESLVSSSDAEADPDSDSDYDLSIASNKSVFGLYCQFIVSFLGLSIASNKLVFGLYHQSIVLLLLLLLLLLFFRIFQFTVEADSGLSLSHFC